MNLTKQFFKYVSQNIFGLIGTSCYILADTYFIAQAAGTIIVKQSFTSFDQPSFQKFKDILYLPRGTSLSTGTDRTPFPRTEM